MEEVRSNHHIGERWKGNVLVFLSGVLYAIALKYFVFPSKVILTGTEGIASALSYYFESQALFLVLYAVFQLALIAFAFAKIGRGFALRSLVVVVTVVLLLAILPEMRVADPEPQNERMILVIFGGLLAGVAKALAFTNRGSTGDEDILGAYFAMKYLKPVGYIAVCAAVVSTVFGLCMSYMKNGEIEVVLNTLMYTCIYIFISAESLNNLYRKFELAMLSVITRNKEMAVETMKRLFPHRTYTVQKVTGGYSGEEFFLVRTIVTHEELPHITDALEIRRPPMLLLSSGCWRRFQAILHFTHSITSAVVPRA